MLQRNMHKKIKPTSSLHPLIGRENLSSSSGQKLAILNLQLEPRTCSVLTFRLTKVPDALDMIHIYLIYEQILYFIGFMIG